MRLVRHGPPGAEKPRPIGADGALRDPQDKGLWLDLHGNRTQTGHTSRMIFPAAGIVSCLSHFLVLEAGDIVTTGTPPGVGARHEAEHVPEGGR